MEVVISATPALYSPVIRLNVNRTRIQKNDRFTEEQNVEENYIDVT
jgi:hypothetical protein